MFSRTGGITQVISDRLAIAKTIGLGAIFTMSDVLYSLYLNLNIPSSNASSSDKSSQLDAKFFFFHPGRYVAM
jgi:hypothetical protein